MRAFSADLFCRVVDNLGDIGVMWRLARQLSADKGWQIRLWVDQLSSLATIEPSVDSKKAEQICQHIEVCHWPAPWLPIEPRPIVIAGFSCDLPSDYLKQFATHTDPIWLQLEYLSAEHWVESFHGLHSQRNDVLKPVFFFPGFTPNTGGLLREADLITKRQHWKSHADGTRWLASLGVQPVGKPKLVSVFTYPHAPLHCLIEQLEQTSQRYHLLVPSTQSLPSQPAGDQVTWQSIPFLSQPDYDKLLWSCDLNLVRGEDSFVRAIWAGQPLLWQIYPQKDGAHHAKLKAWLDLATPPSAVAQAMHEWADGKLTTDLIPLLTGDGWQQWCQSSHALSEQLAQQTDLATKLDDWVDEQTSRSDRL